MGSTMWRPRNVREVKEGEVVLAELETGPVPAVVLTVRSSETGSELSVAFGGGSVSAFGFASDETVLVWRGS